MDAVAFLRAERVMTGRRPALGFISDPSDSRHGTVNGYNNLMCRCPRCKAAGAELNRRMKQRRYEQGAPTRLHGTVNGYCNYGCRCAPCKAAYSAENRVEVDTRKHSPAVVAEVHRLFEGGAQVAQIAARLGLSDQCVYRILRKAGLSPVARRRARVLAMYFMYGSGLSVAEVAKSYGETDRQVRDGFHRAGLPLRKRPPRVRAPKTYGPPRHIDALVVSNRARTAAVAPEHVQRSIHALRRLKASPPRTRGRRDGWLRQVNALDARVDNPESSLSEIAAALGLTKDAYWKLLQRGWTAADRLSESRLAS